MTSSDEDDAGRLHEAVASDSVSPEAVRGLWLVTGADTVLGRALALELARRGRDLVLVVASDHDEAKTTALTQECHGVGAKSCAVLANDINDADAVDRLVNSLDSGRGRPEGIVHHIASDSEGAFLDTPVDRHVADIDRAVRARMQLLRRLGPSLERSRRGFVLTVASAAAFQAVPNRTVVAATETWVVHFTTALHHELKRSGVHATSLCPGLEHIDNDTAQASRSKRWRWSSRTSTEDIARRGIDGVLRNRVVVVPGLRDKMFSVLARLLPRPMVSKLTTARSRARTA